MCACTANSAQVGSLALEGQGTLPSLGADISPLTLSIQNLDQAILRVTIGAPGRWEVPASQLFSNTAPGAHMHFLLLCPELQALMHRWGLV